MFVKKTVVSTTSTGDSGLSKSIDALMGKGAEMLDAGMKVMDEAFKNVDKAEAKTATSIRITLTPDQAFALMGGKALTFKAKDTVITLEKGEYK